MFRKSSRTNVHVESGIKSQFEIQSKSNQGANLRKSPVQQCTHSTDMSTSVPHPSMRADSVHSSTYSCIHNWLLTGGPAATQYQSLIKSYARQPEHMHNHPKIASSQPSKRSTPRKQTEKSTVDTMPPKTTWGGWAGTKSPFSVTPRKLRRRR